MNFVRQKQKVSMIYNHGTKEVETCISEASTYMYSEKAETRSSKVTFKRYMDTNDENNSGSYLNNKENVPIVEIPVTDDEPQNENSNAEKDFQDRKVRFSSRVKTSNASKTEFKNPTPENSDRRLKTILKPFNRRDQPVNKEINEISKNDDELKTVSPPPRKLRSPIETPKSRSRSSSLRPRRSDCKEPLKNCKHLNVLFDGKCLACGISVNDENAIKNNTVIKLPAQSPPTDNVSNETNKQENVEKHVIEANDSNSSSDDELNRTYIVSPKPPTPPRILRQPSQRISRQPSLSRRSPIYECKHRHLEDDGICRRCKVAVVQNKMFSSISSPMEPEKVFANKDSETIRSPNGKSDAISSLPWPLITSRKALAPFIYVNPKKGRFIIRKDTEFIYEAIKMDGKMENSYVKYVFRVSKEGCIQVVTVSSPLKANQSLTDERSSPIQTSKPIYEFTCLQTLEDSFPGYYKHICKALKIISGRVPRIECKNILEIQHLYAKIMINGDFRLIFPNNKVFYHKFGTSDDKIECPKSAEYSSTMTTGERNIFNKAREHLRELDTVHRKISGPNYHGIVVHAHLKSEIASSSIVESSLRSNMLKKERN